MSALRTLLGGSIDYAGLFPPARLAMSDAVAAYASYFGGPDRSLLGRFVVPASRLDELSAAAERDFPQRPDSSPWRLSILVGKDLEGERETILEFNSAHTISSSLGHAVGEAVEMVASSARDVQGARDRFNDFSNVFIEVSPDAAAELVPEIERSTARAKIRTGGITADAFPKEGDLARFIAVCNRHGVPFKATAGLHHPLTGKYRLTYDSGSQTATMYGYVNLFLAASVILAGGDEQVAVEALRESDVNAMVADDASMRWREWRFDIDALRRVRETRMLSFGSCSFLEPVSEARELGLMA